MTKVMFLLSTAPSNVGLQGKKNAINNKKNIGFLCCQISANALNHT
jgi:hypothetical protein